MPPRALAGLRVLDLSTSMSGAWCSRMLADFGADVLAVEPPGGHPLRASAPFTEAGESIPAKYALAGKRFVVLDLEDPRDQERVRSLAADCDVLISSASPSRLTKLRLTYGDVGNPSLVMAHVTPFGMTGSRADLPGNELTVAALSGWASINGTADREPLKPSGWQSAYCTGTAAYAAVLAALHHRHQHPGEGQEVDIAERDVMVSTFAPALLRGQYQGEAPGRRATIDITSGPVAVADGYFALTISRAHFWRDAMNLLGLPDLADDPRWESGPYRQAHKDEYIERVQEKLREWPRMKLFDELASRRCVAGPVLSMEELAHDAHLGGRGFWTRVAGSDEKALFPGAPFRMSVTPWVLEAARCDTSGWREREVSQREGAPATRPSGTNEQPPLAGLRGVVLTQAWAGSYCTELLGLLGADVIQLEVCKRLDSWRGGRDTPLPAALSAVPTARHPWNCNSLYNSVNLNKRCITVDLESSEGLALFKRLLPLADFVVENFSPRVLGNLGIAYEQMRAIKPDLILCSLSAYGHTGPWANTPGIGGTIEPTSGMSALLGYPDGPPLNSGQMYPDAVAGLNGFAAVLTAIHHRDRTGKGQFIDLSMQEANLVFAGDAALEYQLTGRQRPRMGNRDHRFAPHGIYPCSGADRWIAIACDTEQRWEALCRVAVHRDWLRDPRFRDAVSRKANEDALDQTIGAWTRAQDRDHLSEMLVLAGVVAAPVLNGREVAADEDLRLRRAVQEVAHAEAGRWPQATSPLHFSRAPYRAVQPAPCLGEHTFGVFSELLGMTADEYDSLVQRGISGTEPTG